MILLQTIPEFLFCKKSFSLLACIFWIQYLCDCATTWSSKTGKILWWSHLTENLSLKPNQIRQNCIDWIKIFLFSPFLYFLSSKYSSLFLKNWQNHWRLVQIDSDWIISWSWTIIYKWNRQKVIIVKMTLFYLLIFKVQFLIYISICINLGDTLKQVSSLKQTG